MATALQYYRNFPRVHVAKRLVCQRSTVYAFAEEAHMWILILVSKSGFSLGEKKYSITELSLQTLILLECYM